jgi:hypothetical protein
MLLGRWGLNLLLFWRTVEVTAFQEKFGEARGLTPISGAQSGINCFSGEYCRLFLRR